jgi:DNA-binding protein H-NS
MSRPEALVARIHELDEQIGQARRELVAQRRAAIAELFELVGAVEAARLLGITPAAVYKSVYAARN